MMLMVRKKVDDTHGLGISERVGHPWFRKRINRRREEYR
jgi:hypothetical protein